MKHLKLHILSLLAASIVLFMGCSADDTMNAGIDNTNSAVGNVPITLNATVTAAATRAGNAGNIDYSVLTSCGFGVFAYGVDGGDWENKEVTYKEGEDAPVENLDDVHMHTGNWSYGGEKIMWKDQIISFLAYAPYVSKGSGATGITGIEEIEENGKKNPIIAYTVDEDLTKSVDLLWGVREDANLKDHKRVPWLKTAASAEAGDGVLNVTNGKGVTFSFHHALTAIGFHVQAMIDKTNDKGDYEDESNVEGILGNGHYKVTIKKITLKGDFYKTADLYLNNYEIPDNDDTSGNDDTSDNYKPTGKPNWKNQSGSIDKLIVDNKNINESFKHPDNSDATTAETIVESTTITGVTKDAEQLVIAPNSTTGAEQCFFVIPNETKQKYTVTLDWCVSYKNGSGEYVAEDHTSPIPLNDWALLPEVKYYLNFVIGLKSVRLSVKATDWEDNPIYIEDIIEHGTSANESLAKELR